MNMINIPAYMPRTVTKQYLVTYTTQRATTKFSNKLNITRNVNASIKTSFTAFQHTCYFNKSCRNTFERLLAQFFLNFKKYSQEIKNLLFNRFASQYSPKMLIYFFTLRKLRDQHFNMTTLIPRSNKNFKRKKLPLCTKAIQLV